ncbi:hypothetical protein WN51_04713 [Melipona quadrifasciata]|uniref:Uncharacterized protein n=1 Tax=Melipona quadrifasciata TaxID=166423 RepID=A0A0N0BKQ3_9HYME|nr:hypothetical protein WN51_04713 [Melipona quadrifasciata]
MSSWPSLQNSFAMANQTRGLPQMRIKLCMVSAGLQIVLLLTVLPQAAGEDCKISKSFENIEDIFSRLDPLMTLKICILQMALKQFTLRCKTISAIVFKLHGLGTESASLRETKNCLPEKHVSHFSIVHKVSKLVTSSASINRIALPYTSANEKCLGIYCSLVKLITV